MPLRQCQPETRSLRQAQAALINLKLPGLSAGPCDGKLRNNLNRASGRESPKRPGDRGPWWARPS